MKAFDKVDLEVLWKILYLYGCPDIFVEMIRQFYDGMKSTVSVGTSDSTYFPVSHET